MGVGTHAHDGVTMMWQYVGVSVCDAVCTYSVSVMGVSVHSYAQCV